MSKTVSSEVVRTPSWGRLLLEMLAQIKKGEIAVITPDGVQRNFRGAETGERVMLRIHDWRFCEDLFLKGDIGLGESYIEARWDCDGINKLIRIGIENAPSFERAIKGSLLRIAFYRLKHLMNRNSKKGSQKNIHAHYDLGNDFYKLWLDSTMSYSSALFRSEGEGIVTAQENKYENILQKLKLNVGDHILEVGCGWGGFMEYAAQKGIKVTGVTISKEQYEFAQKRLAKYGDLVSLKYQDYRDITGKYDHIVSIEMFEALGEQFWETYFKKLYSILKPGGQLIIQSITINNEDFSSYRRGTDFIQQYIFPGGMLPSPEVFKANAAKCGFLHLDDFEFGADYGTTLKIWEEKFSESLDKIKSIGFDDKFIRTWRFYLKYCQGGFEAGKISVYQFNLIKKGWR